AEAICEAVGRPTMRFVPVKTAEQQATALLHRGREQLVRQRTMLVNALRAHLAEFGIVAGGCGPGAATPDLAQNEPPESASGQHSGDWTDHRHSHCHDGGGCE